MDPVRVRQSAPTTTPAPARSAAPAGATTAVRADLKGASYDEGRAMLSPRVAEAARAGGLEDLTPSQRRYVQAVAEVEAANPKAQAKDIAMALSVLLWEGRIWDADGKASDVTKPAGVPLIGDYAGGDGYKDVGLTDRQRMFFEQQRQVQDRQGRDSGVAHVFPAVAAQAGREGTAAGAVNTRMVTNVGDFIQDVARVLVERNLTGVFRAAEKRDNDRAIQVAGQAGSSSRPLSESLLERFRAENASRGGA